MPTDRLRHEEGAIRSALKSHWTSLAAVGLFVVVLMLAVEHIQLRSEAGGCTIFRDRLEQTVQFNVGLVSLVGRNLSKPLADALAARSEEGSSHNGRILIVYNSMVCQQCLKEGLSALTRYQARLEEQGAGVMAVIASSGEGTMQYTLGLRNAGLLPFPFRYVDASTLEKEFPFKVDGAYIETPLFFHLGEDQRIRLAFKPDRWRMGDLEGWLEAVLAGLPSQQELAGLESSRIR